MSKYLYYNGKIKEISKHGNWIDVVDSTGNIFGYPEQEFYRRYSEGKIVDNIKELIEVGDLVKTERGKIFDVVKPYTDEGLAIVPFNIIFLNEINIISIYKPNEKGDYIKVWEMKE